LVIAVGWRPTIRRFGSVWRRRLQGRPGCVGDAAIGVVRTIHPVIGHVQELARLL
jgi:hypothetical protein